MDESDEAATSASRFLATSVQGLQTPEVETAFILPIRGVSPIGHSGTSSDGHHHLVELLLSA
jgi:hypothetical protein